MASTEMANKESLKEPICSLSDWKSALFPSYHKDTEDNEKTPSDTAVKWSTRAINSLPNKPIKPRQ
jgi:hypothetical protein